jgi:hypothetical protein
MVSSSGMLTCVTPGSRALVYHSSYLYSRSILSGRSVQMPSCEDGRLCSQAGWHSEQCQTLVNEQRHLCLTMSSGDPCASFCFRLELYAPASMYTGYLQWVQNHHLNPGAWLRYRQPPLVLSDITGIATLLPEDADLYSPLSMSRVLVISCSGGASTSNNCLAPLCPAASSCCGHAWKRRLHGIDVRLTAVPLAVAS